MISSVRNPKVQHIRGLQRQAKRRAEAGSFVVDGARLAEEALRSGWPLRMALFTAQLAARHEGLVRALQARGVAEEVSTAVMAAASDTQTPQGILLEIEAKGAALPKLLNFVLILDGVADPGNLGTLLRSAAAADCDAVLLAPGCADAFSPKVVRSGMGAHFHQPILAQEWAAISKVVRQYDLQSFLAEAWKGEPYDKQDLSKPLALILGGEARGAGHEAAKLNPQPVQIPMPGSVESLNVAAAGSILLFEIVRQRQQAAHA
ncbi:MAG: RNA methyltransferase [Anaerolineales bacterium]